MSLLLKGLQDSLNKTRTENNAKAFVSTKSEVLNLFAEGAAMRGRDEYEIYKTISRALAEDLDLGIRALLHLGDIRGGQGERDLLKIGLQVISDLYGPQVFDKVIVMIPELGRWDYVFDYLNTRHEDIVFEMIDAELLRVAEADDNMSSLMFKWMPSIQRKPALAKRIAKHLGLSNKEYRQMLSRERAKLKVVEADMSAKRWDKINYEHVPSKASMIYRHAFKRNDEERYEQFINKVDSGEAKINASTLYPHELVQRVFEGDMSTTLNSLWNNLPDYVTNKEHNVMPLVDVSGSMRTTIGKAGSRLTAMDCSIGLGMYLAERTDGFFKDHFVTFSANPRLEKVSGTTLYQKVINMRKADWGYNTDFIKVFKLLLDTAHKNNLTQKDMPQTIVVFSDMEFDEARGSKTPFDGIKTMFEEAGFKLPQIVFWNLASRHSQHPVTQDESGTVLVSGYSPVTLKYVLTNEIKTPYEMMLEVIMSDRYKVL